MEMTRRGLFRFGAAAVLTAVVASAPVAIAAPILWGDGEHDDTEALQAALDGKPVTVAGERIRILEGAFVGGVFAVSRTIVVADKQNWVLSDVTILATEEYASDNLIECRNLHHCVIDFLKLDHRKPSERKAAAEWRSPESDWFRGVTLVA